MIELHLKLREVSRIGFRRPFDSIGGTVAHGVLACLVQCEPMARIISWRKGAINLTRV